MRRLFPDTSVSRTDLNSNDERHKSIALIEVKDFLRLASRAARAGRVGEWFFCSVLNDKIEKK
jgi:hypothetical protein